MDLPGGLDLAHQHAFALAELVGVSFAMKRLELAAGLMLQREGLDRCRAAWRQGGYEVGPGDGSRRLESIELRLQPGKPELFFTRVEGAVEADLNPDLEQRRFEKHTQWFHSQVERSAFVDAYVDVAVAQRVVCGRVLPSPVLFDEWPRIDAARG